MNNEFDVIVVGAGMVGSALGYGLSQTTLQVLLLDGEDTDLRAAKANFGLVWAHGKGFGDPDYHRLSIEACKQWPAFAQRLEADSGISLAYRQDGGLFFCLSDAELSDRSARMKAWHGQTPELPVSTQILERGELERRFPGVRLGKDVAGASFGEHDGQVNPLRLLAALQTAFQRNGGTLRNHAKVTGVSMLPGGGFEVATASFKAHAPRVVLSAGLGAIELGRTVGLDVPLRPQRGQILVTERVAPLLPIPASGLRQTSEGTVMIGVTTEEVGFDLSTTSEGAVRMTKKALRILPDLAGVRLVRQWSSLRVMTPDGHPVYAKSVSHPGIDVATCHSGVTLASFHAGTYAEAIAAGALPANLSVFHYDRFDVQKTA
ncbi:NAD(P)/FAD-dependent oxidoreductase [Acidovorax sp. LjRoot117]|uniref:NAD(P)/FAD-dependent oxidoreductase n=1 Tax=Acidovorax sp. LjRoot117 TaxID=3342255 RepID=UPI003ECE3A7C